MVTLTVNVLPPGSGDPETLRGHPVYIGTTRYVIEELNEWHWLHLTSPTGLALSACFDPQEGEQWVDDVVASADGLSKRDRSDWHDQAQYYRLRGKVPWLHHTPGGPAICAWLTGGWSDTQTGVRAARLVDRYLADGADHTTTATMVALETGAGIFFA